MTKATDRQVGGNHYASLAIQPMEYALKNDLNYAQANAVKYVTRYKSKGGVEDLRKAIHCIELLIQHELDEAERDKQNELDFDEDRTDIIGQNGNDGSHYEYALDATRDVVHVKRNQYGIGVYENSNGETTRTKAPSGRYLRHDDGLYRLAVSE